ncbi:MAG: YeeE/YedE thiosulfate transporter family protein [Bacteroidota bacterium]
MDKLIEVIKSPWPWYVSGPILALVMLMMIFYGRTFGVSSNLRTICAACGAGKSIDFFRFNWRNQLWNILFLVGAILGGLITEIFLSDNQPLALAAATIDDLEKLGINNFKNYLPNDIFNFEMLTTWQGMVTIIGGGFLVGFGARYAGGCTSGHAITGLSNLQLPSLIAVIGFFIGGLLMTHLLMPFIFV